ncbi:hypothetical protein LA733_2330 [Leptospira interrogans]|nr:hypothetical protein LA733_2330 [Leptospira interrogans]KWV26609.1 hypothetical protein LA702_2176 [Leptospira interrogans]
MGTITNRSFTVKLSNCGNYYKSKFYSQIFKLWELLQTKVLLLNFQNVGTITNRSFTVKLSKCENYYKPKFYS